MTFTEIKTAVKDYCNLSSTEADTRIGKSINRHHRRVTSALGLDPTRFVTRSQSMTVGVKTVTFTEIEKIDRIIDTTDSTSIRPLTETSIHELRSTQPGTGEPGLWAVQSVDADSVTVLFDTVPQSAYSLQADGKTTLSDLSGSDEPVFAESYHDILTFEVIAEELLRKEKIQLAREHSNSDPNNPGKAQVLLNDLRFHLADSPTKDTRQGGSSATSSTGGSGGSGNVGGTAYTQSALLTFDRGAGIVPFAVAQSDAPYVPNLGAEFLGNITTDRLIGRDTAGTGESEQLTVGGGIEFTGSGGIQTSAFTGDVTKAAGGTATTIANDAVTYAKLQNVSAASKLIGRGSASGAGDAEEITLGSGLSMSGTTLSASASSVTALCGGRLTATTGVPVTTGDVAGATSIYYTPYISNQIALYDGSSAWNVRTFTEITISLSGLTASRPYDIFAYDNAGTVTIETLVWTNATTRATALTTQDGVLVKTGATTRRYLGTVYINASGGQTDDTFAKRYVWNYYHRAPRVMRVTESTDNWTYNTATIRQANASTANQIDLVVGVAEEPVDVLVQGFGINATAGTAIVVGIGEDSTTAFVSGMVYPQITVKASNQVEALTAVYRGWPTVGRHFYAWLEYVSAAGAASTFYGDNGAGGASGRAGMVGTIQG